MSDDPLPSRNPEDYRPEPDGHFRRRFREREIPPVVIRKAIEGGELKPDEVTNDDYVKLTTEYLGYEFALIVDPDRQFAISVYCEDDGWHPKGEIDR